MTRTIHTTRDATGPGWAAYCRLRERLESPLDWEAAAIRPWWQSLHQPRHDAPEDAALEDAEHDVLRVFGWSFRTIGYMRDTIGRSMEIHGTGRWAPRETLNDPGVPRITTRELRARLCFDMRPYESREINGEMRMVCVDESVELWMPCGCLITRSQSQRRRSGGTYCRTTITTSPRTGRAAQMVAWLGCPDCGGTGRVPRIEQDEREPLAKPVAGAQWCCSLHPEFPGEYAVYAVRRDFLFQRTISSHAIPIARAKHPDTITLTSGRVIVRARLGK